MFYEETEAEKLLRITECISFKYTFNSRLIVKFNEQTREF